jgi:hypothetical protein
MLPSIDMGLPPIWQSVVMQMQVETSNVTKIYPSNSHIFGYLAGNSLSMTKNTIPKNSIASLGWTSVETLETHLRLQLFEDDWDYPGMEAYDDL